MALHVGVRNLGDVRDIEYTCEDEDENRDAKIHPLDRFQGIIIDVLEEDM